MIKSRCSLASKYIGGAFPGNLDAGAGNTRRPTPPPPPHPPPAAPPPHAPGPTARRAPRSTQDGARPPKIWGGPFRPTREAGRETPPPPPPPVTLLQTMLLVGTFAAASSPALTCHAMISNRLWGALSCKLRGVARKSIVVVMMIGTIESA